MRNNTTLIRFIFIVTLSVASVWSAPLRAQQDLAIIGASAAHQPSGLFLSIAAPDSLLYDSQSDAFVPNPFLFRVSVINRNDSACDSVRATICLPSDMQLDPPGQSVSRYFSPMKIEKWHPNMPENKVDWTVRVSRKPKSRKCDSMNVFVEAQKTAGAYDTTIASHILCLPGVYPLVSDYFDSPDTLSLTSDRRHIIPNPFIIRHIMKSIGKSPAGIREVSVTCADCPGVRLMPNQENPVKLDTVLYPGDSSIASFLFEIYEMSLVWRRVIIESIMIDEDGDLLKNQVFITIPAVDSVLFVEKSSALRQVRLEIENYPNPFSDRTTIRFRMTDDELRMGEQSAIRNPKSAISLKVYDVLGREVLDLTEAARRGNQVTILRTELPGSGVYFCRLVVSNRASTRGILAMQ